MTIAQKLYVLGCTLGVYFSNISLAEIPQQSYFEKRTSILKNTKVTYIKRLAHSNVPKQYYDNPQAYKHDFKRLINEPDVCSQHERVLLLYLVRTVYSHFGRRELLRKIFQDIPYDPYANIIVKHVFLFAKTDNSTIESLIQKESKKYRDIIQEDFVESYTNVSLKTIMAWKWSVEFCANADYVMVMNDELFVDQYKLVPYLHYQLSLDKHDAHFAVCYRMNGAGDLKFFHNVKHVAWKDIYSGTHYPLFCNGVGYVAHIYIINKLYIASLSNRVFMPDDAWLGLLSEKLNISLFDQNYFFEFFKPIEKFSSLSYISDKVMFAVTDKRENNGHEEDIERKLFKIVSNFRVMKQNMFGYILPVKEKIPSSSRYFNTDTIYFLCIFSVMALLLFLFCIRKCFLPQILFRMCLKKI